MKIKAEYTDTYAGEANYGWVRRVELDVPDNLSDIGVVRRVKKALGLEGSRAKRRDNHIDTIALWGLGGCATVLFINWGDN
jgi:hypothetical protein